MSRLRRNHIRRTEYNEPENSVSAEELPEGEIHDEGYSDDGWSEGLSPEEEQALADRIEARRRQIRKTNTRKRRRRVVLLIIAFALILTTCSREIIRLKTENIRLKRQHAQLEEERDRLTRELENVGDKQYIKDQARKQLRLLDPGEIMFIFDDETGQSAEGDDADE